MSKPIKKLTPIILIAGLLFLPQLVLSQTEPIISTLEKIENLERKINQAEQLVYDIGAQIQTKEELPPIKVTLNFSDVTLGEVLNTLSELTDLNIVGGRDLSQRITMYLKDIPLEEALNTIFSSVGYSYIKEGKILRLVPLEEMPLVTKVFELKFVSAEQVKNAILELMSKRGQVQSFLQFSEAKQANALIVRDAPEVIENITGLIKKIDKKINQVMIEVKFVDVTLTKNNELGVDWVLKASFKGAKGPTTFPIGKEGRGLINEPKITEPIGTITLGNISFDEFTATLKALDTQTKVDVISNPRIATREGEQAKIVVGDKVPIPLYERNEETGSIEVTGYQEQNIGVILEVTSKINEDNSITMQLHPEVSEITSYTGPNNERPIVSTKEISTAVTVENGKTIVLGGLKRQDITKSYTKVPLLGDIPVLGAVFKYRNKADENRELLIFITPYILDK